ncbi:MAG: VanZ family protein [Lachnospiraceae bacterium]|nr:VanZ family protein [Lachnospiraceae bacterium]
MMSLILDLLYPLLCIIFPCTMYYLIAVKKVADKKFLFRHTAWTYIFLLYIFMVIQTTGVGTIWDIGLYGDIIRFDEIHLIPFESGFGVENILNIIMFMPLGFLLPLIWERYRKVWKVVLAGAGFSLAI